MMKSTIRRSLLAGALVLAMMASAQAGSTLDGDYRVERLVHEGSVQRFGGDGRLKVKIDGERISGFAGCNRFMGAIQYGDRPLKIGPLASTMMACVENDAAASENAMHKVLGGARSYSLIDGRLIFSNDAGNLVLLVRVNAVAPGKAE